MEYEAKKAEAGSAADEALMAELTAAIGEAYHRTDIAEISSSVSVYRQDDPNGAARDISSALTGINTQLIQETGRWVERYASDLLISIRSMTDEIEKAYADILAGSEPALPRIFVFGLRANGVDHLEFVTAEMKNNLHNASNFENYYRKIFAVKAEIYEEEGHTRRIDMTLAEIKRELAHKLWQIGPNCRPRLG